MENAFGLEPLFSPKLHIAEKISDSEMGWVKSKLSSLVTMRGICSSMEFRLDWSTSSCCEYRLANYLLASIMIPTNLVTCDPYSRVMLDTLFLDCLEFAWWGNNFVFLLPTSSQKQWDFNRQYSYSFLKSLWYLIWRSISSFCNWTVIYLSSKSFVFSLNFI